MPQMAPISWLSLFILFWFILSLFSMMNYFSFLPLSPKIKTKKEKFINSLNWKW
uniref:ATP synthase complex subunit 8 n=1 Tax=Trichophthalma punctata TaxID=395991 RepID=A1YA97_9MUSC|nr:ATP synthase F0 subunit 8 [Trichophthalma punctata]ABH03670.1 ATP synthase F0 subunit 8 [Trichophthalma punctata]